MGNNSMLRFGLTCIVLWLVCTIHTNAQDFINIRKISLFRGDTSIVAGILADVRIDEVDPGAFYYWYGNGQINTNQGGYSGHLLHGEYVEYGPSGKMLLKGIYERGVRSGHWIYWNNAGGIRETREYEDGLLEGTTIRYRSDGKIIHSADYRKHLLHGEMTTVIDDTLYQIIYKNGVEKKKVSLHVFEQ